MLTRVSKINSKHIPIHAAMERIYSTENANRQTDRQTEVFSVVHNRLVVSGRNWLNT